MADYKTNGNLKALIVTGCLAQRYKEEITKEIPEVDAVLGTNSQAALLDAVDEALKGKVSHVLHHWRHTADARQAYDHNRRFL